MDFALAPKAPRQLDRKGRTIMLVLSNLHPATGGGVYMELFFTFLVTVAVGVWFATSSANG